MEADSSKSIDPFKRNELTSATNPKVTVSTPPLVQPTGEPRKIYTRSTPKSIELAPETLSQEIQHSGKLLPRPSANHVQEFDPSVTQANYQVPIAPLPTEDAAAQLPAQDNQPTTPPVPPISNEIIPPQTFAEPTRTLPEPNANQSLNQIPFPAPNAGSTGEMKVTRSNDRITLIAKGVDLESLLHMIAQECGLSILMGESGGPGGPIGATQAQKITVSLSNVHLEDALDAILSAHGYSWSKANDIITVTSINASKKIGAASQGRQVRVFNLNYFTAKQIDNVVKGLLSPVGQSFMNDTLTTDHRRTHEQLVVEDLPQYLDRIQSYISQVDVAPAQVVVEANILQVALKDNCKYGIEFDKLLSINGVEANIGTSLLATRSPTAGFFKIDDLKFSTLMDTLKNTTDMKTLANPKLAVLNGQEARIQIGGKIGYLTSTTTQTTTTQSVNFLELGVILKVVPIITEDGQILMQVKPQVVKGNINPTTNLPDSETTEVETSVMLADGESILIGGLIQETDNDIQNKVPYLGDMWIIGSLFQRREVVRERNEIIITLTPRIIPNTPGCRERDPVSVQQASTKLFHGALCENDRTMWEPVLPDAWQKPAFMKNKVPQTNQNLIKNRPEGPNSEEMPYPPSLPPPPPPDTSDPLNLKRVQPATKETKTRR
jgi:type IV pilus assembly protein PilQ